MLRRDLEDIIPYAQTEERLELIDTTVVQQWHQKQLPRPSLPRFSYTSFIWDGNNLSSAELLPG